MSLFQLYLDEDAMDSDLVSALRHRGIGVTTPNEAGRIGMTDEQQLAYATERQSVLYTFNAVDFCALHGRWGEADRLHAGLVIGIQRKFSIGEQLRRILRLRASRTADQMRGRLEYLGNWG